MTPTLPAWARVPDNAPDTPMNWLLRLFEQGPVSPRDIKAQAKREGAAKSFIQTTLPRLLEELGVKQLDDGRLSLPEQPPTPSTPGALEAITASDDVSSVGASFDQLEARIARSRRMAASVPTREAARELGGTRFAEGIASGKLTPYEHPDKGRVVDRDDVDALKSPAERRAKARAPEPDDGRQDTAQRPSQPQKRERSTALLDFIERHGGRG